MRIYASPIGVRTGVNDLRSPVNAALPAAATQMALAQFAPDMVDAGEDEAAG